MNVEVLRAGIIMAPHAYAFRREDASMPRRLLDLVRSEGPRVAMPVLSYLVRHPRAGTFLIDTGLHASAHASLRGEYGRVLASLFRNLRPAGQPFDAQLRERGVDPASIERVVMTHLHVDHTSGMRLLPNARFVCDRAEWEAATQRGAARNGYAAHHLPDGSRMRLLDLGGGEPYGPFDHSLDLFGDGSVRLLSTPGHTRGHLSVLLDRGEQGPLLVVGDAAYTVRNIDEQILPAFTAGDSTYRESLERLRAYALEHPEATLVPTHDPDAWRAVGGGGDASAPPPLTATGRSRTGSRSDSRRRTP
jgi:N-acyl homoserine lactone hydrolase